MSADNDKPGGPGKRILFALDPKTNKKVRVEVPAAAPPDATVQGVNLETGLAVTVQMGRDPATGKIV